MKGITNSSTSIEFCVHVRREYDYWFESEHRREIIDAGKFVYWNRLLGIHQRNSAQPVVNLSIFWVPDTLKYYHTSKEDAGAGNFIMPTPKYKDEKEDVYKMPEVTP